MKIQISGSLVGRVQIFLPNKSSQFFVGFLNVWKQHVLFLDVLLQYFHQVIATAVSSQFAPE